MVVRITVIDEESSAARNVHVEPAAPVRVLSIVVARDLGHDSEAERFELAAMNGRALTPEREAGSACKPGGIYTLRRRRSGR